VAGVFQALHSLGGSHYIVDLHWFDQNSEGKSRGTTSSDQNANTGIKTPLAEDVKSIKFSAAQDARRRSFFHLRVKLEKTVFAHSRDPQ